MPRGRPAKRKAPSHRNMLDEGEKRAKEGDEGDGGDGGNEATVASMAGAAIPDVSLSTGPGAVFNIECAPCNTDGQHKEAECYCRECGEQLCGDCVRYHRKLSSLKHHQLVDKGFLATTQGNLQVLDNCAERCPEHKNEIIKLFCPDHNTTACVICVALKHKQCERMKYIEDVAAGLGGRQAFKEFTAWVGELAQQSEDTITLALESKQRSSDYHANFMQNLDAYEEDLFNTVKRHVKVIRDQAGQINVQDMDRMDTLVSRRNEVLTELRALATNINSLKSKKHFCRLFVELKRQEQTFREIQDIMNDMKDGEMTAYTFQRDEDLHAMIDRQDGVGKLVITTFEKGSSTAADQSIQKLTSKVQETKNMKAFSTDITLKRTNSKNKGSCTISGMAMISNDKMVIVDNHSRKIKLIETVTNHVVSTYKDHGHYPFDVTSCKDNVAVTLPMSGKIMFLKHAKGLVYDREIRVHGDCRGIDWHNNQLYVVYDKQKKLEVMTTAGVVLKRFKTTADGHRLFRYPAYVTVNAANQRIYVSDWLRVLVLDMAGNQKGTYDDDELGQPRQLAVNNAGAMFLCDFWNESVHLVSPAGKKIKILLTKDDGLFNPWSVVYCETTARLYVGMHRGDAIKVYQVS